MLLAKLKDLQASNQELAGLNDFIMSLEVSKQTRNDLLHALPVKDGSHRRLTNDPTYIRNFYTVNDLKIATEELEDT